MPFSYKPKVEEAIGKLVESDYLEKVVPVFKKDNSLHICDDFQKINQILNE